MTEKKKGHVIAVIHGSKIGIQFGAMRVYLHMLKQASSETVRFNGHGACVLSKGIPLSFDQDDSGQITNVKFHIETPEFPEFEDSQVIQWNPSTRVGGCGYGFAKRGCGLGCRIYFRDDDIQTEGRIVPGALINHAVEEQSDGSGRIKAVRISIYQEVQKF
jgi:hypothetical protein